MNIIMELKKCCNHAFLVKLPEADDDEHKDPFEVGAAFLECVWFILGVCVVHSGSVCGSFWECVWFILGVWVVHSGGDCVILASLNLFGTIR